MPSPLVNTPVSNDLEGGDAEDVGPSDYVGLSKEELLKYANDPYWVRVRWVMFITFWFVWLAMLALAIIIVALGPKCAPEQRLDWWQKDPVYQVYPRSFKDSDGDGVGDIAGLRSKLDYLSDIGAKSVWLSPVFKSPMKDYGYDISDFREVDPMFGSMEDFEALVGELKEKEMHLIMDLVPNHSSDQHDWFQRSIRREEPYTDYYIWADGSNGGPPNDWQSVFGGPAWTYNEGRGQWYYHQFLEQQPDLDFRNPLVVQEMDDVIKFWLDKGVSGFRLDALKHLFETEDLSVAEPLLEGMTNRSDWGQLDHSGVTTDLPETFEVLVGWRQLCDQYQVEDGEHRLLMAEVYGPTETVIQYYGNGTDMADFPFNFLLVSRLNSPADFTGTTLQATIEEWRSAQPNGTWANWVLGNHDQPRVASRVGEEATDALNMLLLLLPGTPVTYYGEELGMADTPLTPEQQRDPAGRDPERTPMQWSAAENAGFTDGQPWLPVNPNFRAGVNVEAQLEAQESHLLVYKKLTKLRANTDSLTLGSYVELIADANTFAFMRLREGSPGFIIIINTSGQTREVDLSGLNEEVPTEATVMVRSSQASSDLTRLGMRLDLQSVPLGPRQGLVLSFVPESP